MVNAALISQAVSRKNDLQTSIGVAPWEPQQKGARRSERPLGLRNI